MGRLEDTDKPTPASALRAVEHLKDEELGRDKPDSRWLQALDQAIAHLQARVGVSENTQTALQSTPSDVT